MLNVKATVTIYLTGTNNLIAKNTWHAGLQKANTASLIITTKVLDPTAGILNAHGSSDGDAPELVAVILLLIVVL